MEHRLYNINKYKRLAMIKSFLVKLLGKLMIPFAMLEQGNLWIKLEVSFGMALLFAPVAWLLKHIAELFGAYRPILSKDSEFIKILVLFLLIDLVCGIWKHWKNRTFDFKQLYFGLLTKVGISFLGMVLFNALSSVDDLEAIPTINSWLLLVGKIMNLVYVGGSAFSSMYIITGGKFPPVAFMNKLKKFNETLDISELSKNEKKEEDGTT